MPRLKMRIGPFSIIICLLLIAALVRISGYIVLTFLLAAFAIHELGHISFGGLMGYQALELKLTPFGGCLSLDPLLLINPEAELLIAAAGPMINLIMAGGVFYLKILGVSHAYLDLWQRVNLLIGVINLVPALPLDGGRICHAFLSGRFGEKTANITGKRITGTIAVLSFILGVYRIWSQQGGLFFIILSLLAFTQVWRFRSPGLDLTWRLWKRKQKELKERGFLQLKPVLVNETAQIRQILHHYGSGEGLLFFVNGREHKLTIVSEEQAWESMTQNGFTATFRETMKED